MPGIKRHNSRGFLLIVVIGMLAVLLTICVGFLSYTRGEVTSVAHQRDKSDNSDVFHSAVDWAIANMTSQLFSGSTFDETKYVSNTLNTSDRTWWYTPFEPNMKSWYGGGNYIDADKTEAHWIYLPEDFFPEGSVRGRFAVQVLDANCAININDWNEDCIPTQAQMAHMFMDAYGERILERYRRARDEGVAVGTGWNLGWTPCPLRYNEAWRVVTHTTRYMDWANWYSQPVDNLASYNWVTGNQSWMGLYGPDMSAIKPIVPSDGIPLYCRYAPQASWDYQGSKFFLPIDLADGYKQYPPANWPNPSGYGNNNQNVGYLGYDITGVALMAGVDPDTGRSPVNVNTVWNSGESLPMTAWGSNPCYTMEAVFNIESLRRIIKVGKVASIGNKDVSAAGVWASLTKAEKQKVEDCRTKLAYRYQEALCRYFTGTYNHGSRKYPQFKPWNSNYATAYGTAVPGAVTTNDYSAVRFKMSVSAFRAQVKQGLLAMCAGTSEVVDFDASDNPIGIAQGKLDRRTAAACYDNVVPGKPANLLSDFGITVDPLIELYDIGRQEDFDDPFNNYGYWTDNPNLYAMKRWTGGQYPTGGPVNLKDSSGGDLTLAPKGREYHSGGPGPKGGPWEDLDPGYSKVPHRQRAFSKDCFSTELTTTANTYYMVINAQLVDEATIKANPNNPKLHRDVSWGQWGCIVELCPDIVADTDNTPGGNPDFQWYKQGKPKYYKTLADPNDPDSMDFKCATLETLNLGSTNSERTKVNSSAVLDFKADIRGIPAAQMASFYDPAKQTKKRVVIRAIWALNTGIMR